MGPGTDEMPTCIGAPMDGIGQGSPPPRSTGGSDPQLWSKDKCAEVGSEDSREALL